MKFAFKCSLFFSLVAFVFGFTSLMILDQSYIQHVRLQKSAFFGGIYALVAFIVSFLIALACKSSLSSGKKVQGSFFKILGLLIAVPFCLFTAFKVYVAFSLGTFSHIDKWSSTRKTQVEASCFAEALGANSDIEISYAINYCGCVYEYVYPRWAYGEYLKNQQEVVTTLNNENVFFACQISASAKE